MTRPARARAGAAGHRIGWDATVLHIDGATVALLSGDEPILTAALDAPLWWPGSLPCDDLTDSAPQSAPLTVTATRAADDEVENTWRAGPWEITWRHTAELVWNSRLVVRNAGSVPLRLRLPITLKPGPDRVLWAVRQGAEGSWAVLGPDEAVWWTDLVQGSMRGDEAGVWLVDAVVQPGAQHVTALRTDLITDLRSRSQARHATLPAWPYEQVPARVVLAHPDLAVLSTDGARDADGQVEVHGGAGETIRTRLAGPRGTVAVDIGFAADLDTTVVRYVEGLSRTWPTGRQGWIIDGATEALLAQHALATSNPLDDPPAIEAAVDGAIARLGEQPSVAAIVLLAQRAVAEGDADLAARAVGLTARLGTARGVTLAWIPVLAAAQLTGVALSGVWDQQRIVMGDLEAESGLRLLGPRADQEVERIGRCLGRGLRGDAVAIPTVERDAYHVALLAQWCDRTAPAERILPHWPVPDVAEVARRHGLRLRHQVLAQPPRRELTEALVWLLLAETAE